FCKSVTRNMVCNKRILNSYFGAEDSTDKMIHFNRHKEKISGFFLSHKKATLRWLN
ncbi:MAG: hypothetical protein ACI9IJ_001329, partial [Psychromonas sp.]